MERGCGGNSRGSESQVSLPFLLIVLLTLYSFIGVIVNRAMKRGCRGNSRGGESQVSLCRKSPDHYQTPVRYNVSPGGSVSSTSVESSYSSGHAAEKNSGVGMYWNATPATHQGRGWSTFGSRHALEKKSRGVIYRNVTPATRGGGGWSNFGSGSSSTGGNVGQSASSSNASSNAVEKSNSSTLAVEKNSGGIIYRNVISATRRGGGEDSDRSSVNLDHAFMESLVHPPEAAQWSRESMPVKSCSEVKTTESTDSLRETVNSEFPIESLMSVNREKRKEKTRLGSGLQGNILRPGMVLLKNYLSVSEQASILKICRVHGQVNVGFYQPQFGDGRKMHRKLMSFGQIWNPEICKYEEVRPTDNSKPLPIPRKLLELVDRAVKDSQSLISERDRVKNVESILPSVKPDICLVNYYSKTGRIGLHQDKAESQESLCKGIPIVSFSIGDSADFLYSDQRDVESADKVILESGDVLIFGGKSRHIFHGVPAIKPDTAPKMLLDETNFRSGRLNLTFRQRC